jgi:hypothetical protein
MELTTAINSGSLSEVRKTIKEYNRWNKPWVINYLTHALYAKSKADELAGTPDMWKYEMIFEYLKGKYLESNPIPKVGGSRRSRSRGRARASQRRSRRASRRSAH